MISKSLQAYFLNCCLWQTFYFTSFEGFTFPGNSGNDDDKQLTKKEKMAFLKVQSIHFLPQSSFKTLFEDVCHDGLLIWATEGFLLLSKKMIST